MNPYTYRILGEGGNATFGAEPEAVDDEAADPYMPDGVTPRSANIAAQEPEIRTTLATARKRALEVVESHPESAPFEILRVAAGDDGRERKWVMQGEKWVPYVWGETPSISERRPAFVAEVSG